MSAKETEEEGNRKEIAKDEEKLWEAVRCGQIDEVRRLFFFNFWFYCSKHFCSLWPQWA